MISFNEYLSQRRETDVSESLVNDLGRLLSEKNIDPVSFAEAEMPPEMLEEFWKSLFGNKNAPQQPQKINFDAAMQAVSSVIQQLQQKGMANRSMSFSSGSMAGQSVPLVQWLSGVVKKLGQLKSKIYDPQTPYSQMGPLPQQNNMSPQHRAYSAAAGLGVRGGADPSNFFGGRNAA